MSLDAALWLRVLAGPLIWFVSLEANFALAPLAPDARFVLIVISVVSLAIAAGVGYFGWRQWRRWKHDQPVEATPGRRALSLGGALINAFSFIVILAQTLPSVIARNQ
ncbi:MAG TPA: hypothetical protein VKX49_13915 [Bryobacteraceae bacterium]|nr:hypothetical protein [Bryobacteraceae bacterium]